MKILICRGTFSPDGVISYNGLICFCHLNRNDTIETMYMAVSKISVFKEKEENVVIAPFSCLDEKQATMNFDEASDYFNELKTKINGSILIDLKYSEIHLNIAPPNAFIKYIELY